MTDQETGKAGKEPTHRGRSRVAAASLLAIMTLGPAGLGVASGKLHQRADSLRQQATKVENKDAGAFAGHCQPNQSPDDCALGLRFQANDIQTGGELLAYSTVAAISLGLAGAATAVTMTLRNRQGREQQGSPAPQSPPASV